MIIIKVRKAHIPFLVLKPFKLFKFEKMPKTIKKKDILNKFNSFRNENFLNDS